MAKKRFIDSVITASKSQSVVLPWAKRRAPETIVIKTAAKAA